MVVGVTEQVDQPDDPQDDREAEAQDARHEPDSQLPAQDVERDEHVESDGEKHRLPP
jgi:hypothetical protein